MFSARFGDDATLFRLASQLEKATRGPGGGLSRSPALQVETSAMLPKLGHSECNAASSSNMPLQKAIKTSCTGLPHCSSGYLLAGSVLWPILMKVQQSRLPK
jgi:hypothetical protein